MRSSLKTKLLGRFTIVLLLTLVVGLVGIYFSNSVQKRQERLMEDVESMHLLSDVSRMVGHIRANSKLHIIAKSVDDMKQYESEIADWQSKVKKNINNLENILKDRATIGKLKEFRSAWETYMRIWNTQVIPLSRANRAEEAYALVRKMGTAGRAAIEVMSKLDELHEAIVSEAKHRVELAEQDFRKSQMISLAVILAAIIFGLAFAMKQSSNIAEAVNAVSKSAQLAAAGDLNQSVKIRTSDEIESMADSFNTMVSNMKKMVEELRHEITEREKAEKSLQEVKNGLEAMVEDRISELRMANEQLRRESIERKRAEEAQRKTEEKFRNVIENIFKFVPESLVVFTNKLNVFRHNKAFEDLAHQYAEKLNYTEEELADIIIKQVKMKLVSGDKSEIRIHGKEELSR